MIDTTSSVVEIQPGAPVDQPVKGPLRLLQPIGLGVITLISLFMNFYQLGQNGFGNLYYASAIRSMLDNWHNFFFVSFDPGGFVSVDKPPLGFWLQAASAKLFGFTPFSIFLPQALAGVFSVLLLYHLVRRHFGVVAGLLAALALAISPISVITNRNNTIDSTLVLTMLLGAWTVMKATETGKWRWLMLTAVLVGLGFNIKMLEAYLVVPAYGLLYLLGAPRSLKMRIWQLIVAAGTMLVVSLSWAVAVDLTSVLQRPYVGSSQNNSEVSLALGYNGIQRLLSSFGVGGGAGRAVGGATGQTPPTLPSGVGNFPGPGAGGTGTPPQGFGGNGGGNAGGGGGMFNTGTPGVLRLFNEPLGGQIVWLLPMALMGMLALAWQRRTRLQIFQENRQMQSLVLWGTWLLTMAIFFSVAGFFHQYYLSTLAPAICALFGIGVVVMWQDYRRGGWRGWLLPIALVLTALEQIHIILSNPAWGMWLIPLIAVPCALAAGILAIARLLPRLREKLNARVLGSALCVGLLALLLTSAVWSAKPVLANVASNLPVAGPSSQAAGGFGGGQSSTNTALVNYLETHKGNAKYLVAVVSSQEADSIILSTNQPVMAMGGFSGSDPILTTSQLATLAKNGTVHYFLLNSNFGGPGGGQSTLTTWIKQHSTLVSPSQYQSSTSTSGGLSGGEQLYEYKS